MSELKVVVKYIDGDVLKGFAGEFYKAKEDFLIKPHNKDKEIKIRCNDIKAVFYVKTFEGRAKYRRLKHLPRVKTKGKPVVIHFNDGERIEGFTQYYRAEDPFLLLIPDDPTGNNQRIFCNQQAVKKIEWDGGRVTYPLS